MVEITKIIPVEQETTLQRIAAYCRVSSDSEDQRNSYIRQVKYYTEYIGGNPDWILADIYADSAVIIGLS